MARKTQPGRRAKKPRKTPKGAPRRFLADGRGRDFKPASEKELVAALLELDALFRAEREPRIAVIFADQHAEDPPRLSIGLGGRGCTLVFDQSGMTGEGGYSKGPRARDEPEVTFAYGTGHSHFPAWTLISKRLAVAAAREFFRTGERPTNVDWVDL